jgi:hypothetical protein
VYVRSSDKRNKKITLNYLNKMTLKNVIIRSIGTAKPSVGKVLADVLGVSNELVVKLLYRTPSVLFQQVEEELAANTQALLVQLGLEVEVTAATDPLPEPPALYDLAIFLPNPLEINKVNSQLAEFLGCKEQESLALLLKDPAVVLGGVSAATAAVLSQRVDAEVIITSPATDLYTIKILNKEAAFLNQLDAALKNAGLTVNIHAKDTVEDVDYTTSQQVWQRMAGAKGIEIYNQSFLRYEIILNSVDENNPAYRQALTTSVGMPPEIIDEVLQQLPVQLHDSVNRQTVQELLQEYNAAGLHCSVAKIPFGNQQLTVENIDHAEQAEAILNQVFKNVLIKKETKKWVAPEAVSPVLGRLLAQQLQQIGCEVETKPITA